MRYETRLPVVAPRWRMWAVAAGLSLALVVLALKAAHLQLAVGDELRELAERQYVRKLKVSAPRGNIYDRAGRPLAVTVPAWSVAAEPRRVEDPAAAAAALAPVLQIDEEKLRARLSSKRGFSWLDRRVDPNVAEAVRALELRGISLRQESRRYYPNRELAGQLLGLVSIDGEGVDGVERAFEEHLRGRSAVVPGLRDNRGQRIVLGSGLDLELLEGDDVYLTLDARVQHVAERALLEVVESFDAKSAFAVVLDPKTGAVLAMANAPLFNPNDPGASPKGARRNHALSDAFEPGSVFKIVSFASALEAGVLSPTDSVFCENGRLALGKYVIRDAHAAGWLTAAEVFSHSSNIGTIKIVQRAGEERFRETVRRFGFGQEPGLGLIGETAGRLPDQPRWGEVRTATVSYGHGFMASALQVATMVATVANGGLRVTPRLLDRVASPTGEVVRTGYSDEGERVISEETARVLTQIMSGVVEAGGTGQHASIRGVRVAGKTGTAEKVDPVTKRYSRELHLSSFVGFAPAEDPRVVAVVVVDEPKGVVYGGPTAGRAWRAIVEAALIDAGVLTEEEAPLASAAGAPQAHKGGASASAREKGGAAAPVLLEELDDEPENAAAEGVARRYLGMTARQAVVAAEDHGVEVRVYGSGVVVKQSPEPGAPLLSRGPVELHLEEDI